MVVKGPSPQTASRVKPSAPESLPAPFLLSGAKGVNPSIEPLYIAFMQSYVPERIRKAFWRARFGIGTIALTYALSLLAGLSAVHSGSKFALGFRDRLVAKAQRESVILRDLDRDNRLRAAGFDAAGNAGAAALGLVAGYFPPVGYGAVAFRGWVGGVVSVDDRHRSRLGTPREAFYYITTLILQLIPYSLVGGAGVNIGIATFGRRGRVEYPGSRVRWLLIPHAALGDAGWIYLVSLPLFAIASLFEFLAV